MSIRSTALISILALASPVLADAPPAPIDALELGAPVESARLDLVAVESGAALELFGLSSGVTTGLIVGVIALTGFITMTDGSDDTGGVVVPPAAH